MPDPDYLAADFSPAGDAVVARMAIVLDAAPGEVWSALTEPDQFVQWLAPGSIELRQGGAARLDFVDSGIVIDSTVSAIEPGRLLEYSWSRPGEPDRPLRYGLEPQGEGTRLTLELRVPAGEDAARSAAGWAAHLEMLAGALMGVPMKFPFDVFKAARAGYQAQLAPAAG